MKNQYKSNKLIGTGNTTLVVFFMQLFLQMRCNKLSFGYKSGFYDLPSRIPAVEVCYAIPTILWGLIVVMKPVQETIDYPCFLAEYVNYVNYSAQNITSSRFTVLNFTLNSLHMDDADVYRIVFLIFLVAIAIWGKVKLKPGKQIN